MDAMLALYEKTLTELDNFILKLADFAVDGYQSNAHHDKNATNKFSNSSWTKSAYFLTLACTLVSEFCIHYVPQVLGTVN